jgi:hypothetical protein
VTDGSGNVTSGETIDQIEPAPNGLVYFLGTEAGVSTRLLTVNVFNPNTGTGAVLKTYAPAQGTAAPTAQSLAFDSANAMLAYDVSQSNGSNNVYLYRTPIDASPPLVASQPSARVLGWDSFHNLYVMSRTFTNATSPFCADSTTFTVWRYERLDLFSPNPPATVWGRATFPGKNFIVSGSSTDTQVSANGDVLFGIYQAACGPATIQFKTRRLVGVAAGGGVPRVLDEAVTEPATSDLGYIGIALGTNTVYRSSTLLANIVSFPLSALTPPIDWAAQNLVDFDGNQVADLGALYRGLSPQDSLWYAPGTFQIYFGATSDVPVPGDYNGDGKTDAAIYRPATAPGNGLWYGPATGLAQIVIQMNLGNPGDIPVPGDYDGDGKTDPAIYRPSSGMFFAVLSAGGTKSSTFGAAGDVPVPRDYDGDGKTDFGIYRQNATPDHLSLWYAPVSGGEAPYQIYFGAPGDIPVPGDYNRDHRAEAMIFRESTGLWYGPYNNGGSGVLQFTMGGPGDVPIPGYYDADQNMDPAIYHKANGFWFALLSSGGTAQTQVGQPTDIPIQKRPALAGGL